MRKRKADLLLLVAELEADLSLLEELRKKNQRAWERVRRNRGEELEWAALGYTIHNIYNLLENYFLRVAKFFENSLEPLSWHRDLIRHMSLEVEGLRPALLDHELGADIDELRAFRHVFRNIYQSRLDPDRVETVQKKLEPLLVRFNAAHQRFAATLRAIAMKLDE